MTQVNATEGRGIENIPFKRSNYLSLATVSRRLCSWWAELSRKNQGWSSTFQQHFINKNYKFKLEKIIL
jgi:hypothetical protein